MKSDGSIWFSDPAFGITWDYEGHRAEPEIDGCDVCRVDPATGEIRIAADGFAGPNGVVFSPDEGRLHVSDTGADHIRAFGVREDGTLSDGRALTERRAGSGRFDTIRFDGGGDGRRSALLRPRRNTRRTDRRTGDSFRHHLRRPEERPPLQHREHLAPLAGHDRHEYAPDSPRAATGTTRRSRPEHSSR